MFVKSEWEKRKENIEIQKKQRYTLRLKKVTVLFFE